MFRLASVRWTYGREGDVINKIKRKNTGLCSTLENLLSPRLINLTKIAARGIL